MTGIDRTETPRRGASPHKYISRRLLLVIITFFSPSLHPYSLAVVVVSCLLLLRLFLGKTSFQRIHQVAPIVQRRRATNEAQDESNQPRKQKQNNQTQENRIQREYSII